MRGILFRGACLLAAWLALAPAAPVARAQGPGQAYAPPWSTYPLPLGSTRPEDGGLYLDAGYVMLRGRIPLKSQQVAIRGFQASDYSLNLGTDTVQIPSFIRVLTIGGDGRPTLNTVPYVATATGTIASSIPGQFFGSGVEALNTNQLTGQDSWQSGFKIGVGWRFDDGSAVSLNWKYLSETQMRAGATLAPRNGAVGLDLADSFLYSPVFNFPPEFGGADFKVNPATGTANAQAVYGLWNGASIQTIDFRQRFQQWDIMLRTPVYETEDYRLNGLVGPRLAWIWERFAWRTTSIGQNPDGTVQSGPQFVGLYTNITSNRMYGTFIGCEQECYLGHGFALMLNTQAALYIDSVKERAKYETADKYAGLPENKRAKREWSLVPSVFGQVGLMWYPTEFIQLYLGYEYTAFINTLTSRRPIDFDYSNLAPKWSHFTHTFDGFQFNVAFRF